MRNAIIQFRNGETCGKRIAGVVCSPPELPSWGDWMTDLGSARGYRTGGWPMSARV